MNFKKLPEQLWSEVKEIWLYKSRMGSHKSREKIELFLPKYVTLLKNSVFSC